MQIPAQRQPEPAETGQPSPAPAMAAGSIYSAVVLQAGCNQAGDEYRTHQAVVTVQPKGDTR